MNKIFNLLVLGIMVILASCSTHARKENQALKAELDSLKGVNTRLAEGNINLGLSVDAYQAMLAEINQQLSAIDEKHELVKSKSKEYANDPDTEQEILLHIEHLHNQMENAKHKINHLNRNMDELRRQNAGQHERIHQMDMELKDLAGLVIQRDSEITFLHEALFAQGITLGVLADAYADQAIYNEVLLDILNTGFYVAGTHQELKDMGIIDMEGGFIGIGRVKTLNANAPVEFMTPIDIREVDLIELSAKKAQLITTHPSDSYELSKYGKDELVMLGIVNKSRFWQETNYLVIELN